MKRTIYAIGNNVELADHSSSFLLKFFEPATMVPDRNDIKNDEIVSAFTKCTDIKYFITEKDAWDCANKIITQHIMNRILSFLPVFRAEIMINNNFEFIITKLNDAKISDYPEFYLNYTIDMHQLESMTSFSSFSSSRAAEYKCTKDNLQGDFQKLQRMILAERESLNFLFGNKKGFMPEGKTQKYNLPKDVAKVICEYIREEPLPLLKK